MSNGPQLVNGRDRFACGTFESGAKTMAIVAGGFDGKSSVSTEIWDPMSENGWVEGKKKILSKHNSADCLHFFLKKTPIF